MRTPFVVGNWKLHKNVAEAQALVTELKNQLGAIRDVAVGVAPPFTALWPVARRLEDSHLVLAAQDCFWEEKGAWTGEVAPTMLADVGCTWTLVGHSERRTHFGETDATVGKKVAAALKAGLGVIACVGETEAQRDANQTFAVVDAHLDGALAGGAPPLDRFVIAYEPVWAIGTGRVASAADAQEVCGAIRSRLGELASPQIAEGVRVLYGGSMNAKNVGELVAQEDVDGGLVGGASLDGEQFATLSAIAAGGPLP